MFCGGVFSLNRLQSSVIITSPRQSLLQVIGFIQKNCYTHVHHRPISRLQKTWKNQASTLKTKAFIICDQAVTTCPYTACSTRQCCCEDQEVSMWGRPQKMRFWSHWKAEIQKTPTYCRKNHNFNIFVAKIPTFSLWGQFLSNLALWGQNSSCESLFVINFEEFLPVPITD